jgi:predicted nucleic acid-binding protein
MTFLQGLLRAQQILQKVEDGEPVVTTPAHMSEVANILESRVTPQHAATILQTIVALNALTIHTLTGDHIKAAATLSQRLRLGFNDTLAYLTMKETGTEEIYSFDTDFDMIQGITRRTK